jgi:hypothetical protein
VQHDARQHLVSQVLEYLRREFPDESPTSAPEPRTNNELFRIGDGAAAKTLNVSERWFDGDTDVMSLREALEKWPVAAFLRRLPAGSEARMRTEGVTAVTVSTSKSWTETMPVRLYWTDGRVEDLKREIVTGTTLVVRNVEGGHRHFLFAGEFDNDGFAVFTEDVDGAID